MPTFPTFIESFYNDEVLRKDVERYVKEQAQKAEEVTAEEQSVITSFLEKFIPLKNDFQNLKDEGDIKKAWEEYGKFYNEYFSLNVKIPLSFTPLTGLMPAPHGITLANFPPVLLSTNLKSLVKTQAQEKRETTAKEAIVIFEFLKEFAELKNTFKTIQKEQNQIQQALKEYRKFYKKYFSKRKTLLPISLAEDLRTSIPVPLYTYPGPEYLQPLLSGNVGKAIENLYEGYVKKWVEVLLQREQLREQIEGSLLNILFTLNPTDEIRPGFNKRLNTWTVMLNPFREDLEKENFNENKFDQEKCIQTLKEIFEQVVIEQSHAKTSVSIQNKCEKIKKEIEEEGKKYGLSREFMPIPIPASPTRSPKPTGESSPSSHSRSSSLSISPPSLIHGSKASTFESFSGSSSKSPSRLDHLEQSPPKSSSVFSTTSAPNDLEPFSSEPYVPTATSAPAKPPAHNLEPSSSVASTPSDPKSPRVKKRRSLKR